MYNVLIVNADQILGASVTKLLMAEKDIDLAAFSPACPAEIIERLQHTYPDVLILANNLITENVLQQILEIKKTATALKIIIIDVDDNQVSLNGSQLLPITHSADLINIVRADQLVSSRKKHRKQRESVRSVQHRNWPIRSTNHILTTC